MKRVLAISFSLLMLCCILLVGVTKASEPGYSIPESYTTAEVDVNGNWVTGEWEAGWLEYISNGSVTDDRFVYKMTYTTAYYMSWLIDFSDHTDDTGDIWQLCIDGYPAEVKTAPDRFASLSEA